MHPAALADYLPPVAADRDRIEQVLVNLLHNSIKFTPSGGGITISAISSGDFLQVSVNDTGVGIPEQDLPYVCSVFWQGGNALASKSRGLGLGLAVARRVAENHGGALDLVSEVEKGTAVSFYLPPLEATPA